VAGLAVIQYVQNLRIEEAKHLLESSDQAMTISVS
jgi:transcriptional regulator GlxA family with amidase domain